MKKFELTDETKIVNGTKVYRIRALIDIRTRGVSKGDLGGFLEKESNLSHFGNAIVCGDASVISDAIVCGNASVIGDARVYGNAVIDSDARVSSNAVVYGNAMISGNAVVAGNARVASCAVVCDDASVYGNAMISGNARVSGNAVVYGNAMISGNARVSGNAVVDGNASIISSHTVVWFSNVGTENGVLTVYKNKDGGLSCTRGCFTGTIDEFLAKSASVHNDNMQKQYKLLIEMAKLKIEV